MLWNPSLDIDHDWMKLNHQKQKLLFHLLYISIYRIGFLFYLPVPKGMQQIKVQAPDTIDISQEIDEYIKSITKPNKN
jgi:hypothetical protein